MKRYLPLAAVAGMTFSSALSAKTINLEIHNTARSPLSNVTIKVRGTTIESVTDANGRVILDLGIGQHTIDVEANEQTHFHHQIDITEQGDYSATSPILISLISEPEHKLVINANPLEHTALDMATPIILIAGDELISKKAGTLGEILQLEPGLSVSSFGPAVSRPIIRGLGGSRVKITNNQMTVLDASTNSADHDVGLEPLLAEQIEVVKGPATLLYGSGAIGGVINITDRKINSSPVEELTGGIELRLGDSATSEESAVLTLDGGTESWNWHVDGYSSETDDLEIPGFAESHIFRAHEEEEHEGEEPEDEHGDEVAGVLENSSSKNTGFNLGSTWLFGEKDYFGISVGQIDKEYGIPGHAEHGEHGEEEHEEEEHEDEHEEGVAIDMEQTRYDMQLGLEQPMAGIDSLFAGVSYTDYQHQELEGDEIGTKFENEASEFRGYIKHAMWNGWTGVIGTQFGNRDFSSVGEEAIIPASTTKNAALFWLEEKHFGDLKWELGARFEKQTIEAVQQADVDSSGVSYSIGAVYSLAKHNKLAVNLSHATRFASVEELFVDGAHLATRSYEIGNSDLEDETSNNFDFSYRFETTGFSGELNLFWNDFFDFIYAQNATLVDSCVTQEAFDLAEEDDLLLVCYQQQDATYKGVELQIEIPLIDSNGHQLSMDLFADKVTAELNNGDYLPRIPSSKAGIQFNYDYKDWSASLVWINHTSQKDTGTNELPTEGFKQLEMETIYRLPIRDQDLFFYLKGKNLLDKESRDHSSFIKDLAPRAGRSFQLGMRYSF
ncbi:MAG: TonB-dependent receptor [Kangiellaceae bacterium]|nr:TonB-dependent receptor [Kangiellaceae bacterium]